MREEVPLATIHEAVLDFLRGRNDAVVFGAQAVNAYVGEARMSQDINLISTRAVELAEELRAYLSDHFHIAVRVRALAREKGFGYFRFISRAIVIWLICVRLSLCHAPNELKKCW